jgi:hypothetical protein
MFEVCVTLICLYYYNLASQALYFRFPENQLARLFAMSIGSVDIVNTCEIYIIFIPNRKLSIIQYTPFAYQIRKSILELHL